MTMPWKAAGMFLLIGMFAALLTAQYTPPTYTQTGAWGDWLSNITINQWSYPMTEIPTGDYAYNQGQGPGTLQGGVQYTASVTNGSAVYPQGVTLFIDYSQNGTFEHLAPSLEAVGSVYLAGAQTSNIIFTVPSNVASGTTRMRLMNVYSNQSFPFDPHAQLFYSYGQAIDFDVTISTGPTVEVDAEAGTATSAYTTEQGPGGNGFAAGKFTLESGTVSGGAVTEIELTASGSGNDANAFFSVAIYRDNNANDTFEHGTDILVTQMGNFTADDGDILFNVVGSEPPFGVNDERVYFVVVQLAGTASPGDTFDFTITDMTVTGTNAFALGLPSTTMNGIVIATPEFEFTDASAAAAVTCFLGSTGNVCQTFDIEYLGGPDDRPGNITVTGLGTADEAADLVSAQLWLDADQSGDFDAGLDTLIDTQSYVADNGTVTFNMSSHPNFTALDVRRFFVVYNLDLTADDNETFQCYVSAMATAPFGGIAVNLPAPSTNGAPGLVVSANVLLADVNGPSAPIVVHSNTTGPHGDGALLLDFSLQVAPGASWTVSGLTFNASGTGNHDAAYSELALYLDEGSGTWDGAAVETLAAATLTGFSGGAATFTLTSTSFPQGTTSRFFLVGKMNGTATAGQTFNANLESISATPPAGGAISGVPTIASSALLIDAAAVAVGNATGTPTETWHRAGSAAHYVVGRFSVMALNDAATVNGLTFTSGGTGDWNTGVSATDGVEVYEDDGDGVFDTGTDVLIFQGGGGASVNALFTSPIVLAVSQTTELWVRIGLTDTAGSTAITGPEMFTLSVASASDINASATGVRASPAPATTPLGAIAFNITSFSPTSDLPAGGKAITIQGSGFVAPLTVTIGGIICPGTPVITGGTEITGLTVPAGGGSGLPIVITTGNLPPQTHSSTFRYRNISTGSGSDGGGGCEVASSHGVAVLALAAGLALLALRRRRTA